MIPKQYCQYSSWLFFRQLNHWNKIYRSHI